MYVYIIALKSIEKLQFPQDFLGWKQLNKVCVTRSVLYSAKGAGLY